MTNKQIKKNGAINLKAVNSDLCRNSSMKTTSFNSNFPVVKLTGICVCSTSQKLLKHSKFTKNELNKNISGREFDGIMQ